MNLYQCDPGDPLDEPLAVLDLGVRTINAYERCGVLTVRQLLGCCPLSADECKQACHCVAAGHVKPTVRLPSIGNIGRDTVAETIAAVQKYLDSVQDGA